MKLIFICAVFAVLATIVVAWEKEDYEIFDLVSEVEASEGKSTTFYSWLDVPPTASTAEIAKAYRKMSVQLHPDKNPGVKGAHERFGRLGVVSSILRKKESRQRYDFFYKNGVPKWRGTGYYYSRFRPGLGSVLAFLIILTSGLQLLVQRINYKRDLERIEKVRGEARSAAWGPKLVPNVGKRKVKINLGTQHEDGGNTKWIDMVVDGQDVYILDPSGEMHLLDSSSAVKPTLSNTWFLVLVKSLYLKVFKSTKDTDPSSKPVDAEAEDDDRSSDSDASRSVRKENGIGARAPAVKAGGKRRKATRKR